MIKKEQLNDLVKETLEEIGLYSVEAKNLVLGTIAVESLGGTYLRQYPTGPALGICQMETATHNDIWNNFLTYKKGLAKEVNKLMITGDVFLGSGLKIEIQTPESTELVWNLKYSIAMCRIHYLRVPSKLPASRELQAQYWKDHYNTHLGAGTPEKYLKAWKHCYN